MIRYLTEHGEKIILIINHPAEINHLSLYSGCSFFLHVQKNVSEGVQFKIKVTEFVKKLKHRFTYSRHFSLKV